MELLSKSGRDVSSPARSSAEGSLLTDHFVRGCPVWSLTQSKFIKVFRSGCGLLGCPPTFYCTASVALL